MDASSKLKKVPARLHNSGRWITYRKENIEGREAKVPYDPRSGCRAFKKDADGVVRRNKSWCGTLEQVLPLLAGYDGPGLDIGAPLIGIDLDECRDPETGAVDEHAERFIKQLNSYTELSPSKTGFHIWLQGDAGDLTEEKRDLIEVYACNHYLTVTGDHVEGTPEHVREASKEEIEAIFTQVREGKVLSRPVLEEFQDPKKWELLSQGKLVEAGYDDASKAVHAYTCHLVYKLGPKEKEIDEAFRASGMYAVHDMGHKKSDWVKKWNRLHKKGIAAAIKFCKEHPLSRKKRPNLAWELPLQSFDDVEEDVLEWLWPGKVPTGNATIFAGDPGVGKSLMALDLAGRGSIGADFLDDKPNKLGKFKTLLLAQEDDRKTIIKPRLLAMGADPKMIFFVDMAVGRDEAGQIKEQRPIDLESDLDRLRESIKANSGIKLVIIDPLSNYMGSKSLFRDQEMRQVLMPVIKFAQDTGVSVIVIMHNSKQTGRTALGKIGAALGGVGTVRIGWAFVPNGEGSSLMLILKKNLGNYPGIEYTTEGVPVEIKGQPTEQARMKFLRESRANIENVMANSEDPEAKRDKPAVALIKKMVPVGKEVPCTPIFEAAAEKGISEKSVKRAKGELGLRSVQRKDGWYWSWPADVVPSDQKLFQQSEM